MSKTTTTHKPDKERDYRLIIDRARGLRPGDPVPPRSVSPLRCRPPELRRRLDEWASATLKKLDPVMRTYWIVCRAYPVRPPWLSTERPAECTVTVQPEAPSCLRSMAHDWRIVDPSVHVCSRCGLRHEYHTRAASGAAAAEWPWEQYGWSGDHEVGEEERIS